MSTEAVGSAIKESLRESALRRRRQGRWFFVGFAIVTAATVLLGFSRTYYFKEMFAAPSLPTLFHIHGALFTAWVLLFIVQALLIARARTAVHRQLGIVGVLLVAPVLVTGAMVAIVAAKGEGPVGAASCNLCLAPISVPSFQSQDQCLGATIVPRTSTASRTSAASRLCRGAREECAAVAADSVVRDDVSLRSLSRCVAV